MDIDTAFFTTFRQMFLQGTVSKIGVTAYAVYSCIKAHTDFNDGLAFPSQKVIAEQTGLSERQVQLSLKVLEQEGLLVRSKDWKHNVYRLKEKITGEKVIISWDYLPAALKKARQELQNYLMTGDTKDAKIIHIERLELTINQNIVVTDPFMDLDKISDPHLREQMKNLLSHAKSSRETTSPDDPSHPK
jgi:biotin operon repressor